MGRYWSKEKKENAYEKIGNYRPMKLSDFIKIGGSMEFQDTIEAKSVKPTTRIGTTRYAFKMANMKDEKGQTLWVSTLDDELGNTLSEGDEALFEVVESKGFYNIKSAEKIVHSGEKAETGIDKEPTFPDEVTTGDLIIRQMAYKAAVDSFEKLEMKIADDTLTTHMGSLMKIAHSIYFDIKYGKDWD